MAKAAEVRNAKKNDRPFGAPVDDETFETLIPEGAESGKIPAGDKYIGKIIGLRKETSSNDNPMWVWDFEIVEGDFAGMTFTQWTTLTNNSLWKLADTLTALGVDWEPGEPINFKRSEVLGTLCRLVIRDDKYQGRETSKLDRLLPHPDGAGKKAKKGGFTIPAKAEEEDEEEELPRKKTRRQLEEEIDDEEAPPAKRGRAAREDEDEDEEERADSPRQKDAVDGRRVAREQAAEACR